MSLCRLDTYVDPRRKIFNCKISFKCPCQGASCCDQVLLECHFQKKITITATEVVLIHLFSLTVVSDQKVKMKTRNTMALSCHSKVNAT